MNPLTGEAELDLGDGREFTLVFDYEAMIVAEATYGHPIGVTSVHADQGFVGALRAMLFGTTRAHHPETTLAEATDITFRHATAVKDALNEAAKNSMPPAATHSEGKEGSRPPRAGTNSGANGAKPGSTRKGSSGQPRARSTSSSPRD